MVSSAVVELSDSSHHVGRRWESQQNWAERICKAILTTNLTLKMP